MQSKRFPHKEEEILVSVMEAISLDDIEQMEIKHNTNLLDVDMTAFTCNKTVSPNRTNITKQSSPANYNNDLDLTPFNPDYQLIETKPSFKISPNSESVNLTMLTFSTIWNSWK